ncbi:MAG: polysaccharide biosynthesis/export family protein [Pseudomonadota bacterium]|nr:polysaccharide biosynthesis/export family protein [Pseudomonadota bacterium]
MFASTISASFRLLAGVFVVWALSACETVPTNSSDSSTPAVGTGATTGGSSTASKKSGSPAKVYEGYHIGAEDLLFISVWKEEELQREVTVRPDGGISFPLAGNLQVAGKTVPEVEAEITRKIRRYIPEAVVTVSVKTIAGYSVFVIGKVENPGQFTLGRYIDVIQALTLAGGVTPFANEDNISILRRTGGKEIVFSFDYSDVKKGKNLQQNITLKSGDVVVVP